uniref:GRAM domain containing 2B n=1 Tax=Seriola dumerili TaxID=41447 RepID=A0A3B4VQI3_SERDU
DHSLLTQVQTDSDSKIERKKSHYSQSVLQISLSDLMLFTCLSGYTCALQKDILYQGRMFVSDHWICFHSKVFGKDTKIAIPVVSVTHIKKTKTAILVPNALVIATANDRYVFVSLLSRDNTYKFLMSVCLHLEVGQMSHICFSGDFIDLDGAVRQRRQEMEESSSSDSQTPDYEKIAGITSRVCVLVLSSCYLAFKIVSLEQTLTTLGSVTDFTHKEGDFLRGGPDVNTQLFSELLTINLMKLEKVS